MSAPADVRVLHLLRLLQLASPALPVGAYSYSQGLESAVASGGVCDERSAAHWIEDVLTLVIAGYEGPMLLRMLDAGARGAAAELHALNATFLASRESAELRAETVQMGRSLCRLLGELNVGREKAKPHPAETGGATGSALVPPYAYTPVSSPRLGLAPRAGLTWLRTGEVLALVATLKEPSYPCAWACAALAFGLPHGAAYPAYLWAWAENQVMAALKLVPLGQSAGQRILVELASRIDCIATATDCMDDERLTNFAPGLAIASSRHETQYSRLFRS